MGSALIRGALVVVAVLVGAWLVLSLRAVEIAADGRAVILQGQVRKALSPAQAEHGLSLLRRARDFNADRTPVLDEVSLLLLAERPRRAEAVARGVVRDEPENVGAWTLMFVAARHAGDRATAARAAGQVRELNPLFARTLTTDTRSGS